MLSFRTLDLLIYYILLFWPIGHCYVKRDGIMLHLNGIQLQRFANMLIHRRTPIFMHSTKRLINCGKFSNCFSGYVAET